MIDLEAIQAFLVRVVEHYEKMAPTVSRWADSLYIRLSDDIYSVWLVELLQAQALLENDHCEHPNLAANCVYKLMTALGQDTRGHAGY